MVFCATSVGKDNDMCLLGKIFFFNIFFPHQDSGVEDKKLQARTSHRLPVYRREGTRKPKLVYVVVPAVVEPACRRK